MNKTMNRFYPPQKKKRPILWIALAVGVFALLAAGFFIFKNAADADKTV